MISPNGCGMTAKPITDISERAAAFGRIIDRLAPGHYTVSIIRPTEGPLRVLITQQNGAEISVIKDIEIRR